MPQFKFRLQKILDLRKYREEVKKQELAKLMLEYYNHKKLLEYLKSTQEKYQEEMKEKQTGDLDIFEMIFYWTYLLKLQDDIEKEENTLCKLQEEIDLKKEEVIQAQKERKIIEKLKEKKLSDFIKSENIAEQKFLDEIGINKFNRE